MFGVFGTSPRQMLINIAFALLVFGVAFMYVLERQESGYLAELEFAYGAMVLPLLMVSVFASRYARTPYASAWRGKSKT